MAMIASGNTRIDNFAQPRLEFTENTIDSKVTCAIIKPPRKAPKYFILSHISLEFRSLAV